MRALGARKPGGTWSKWTPPCAAANGPATLAAWSATDLIAVVLTGNKATSPIGGHAESGAVLARTQDEGAVGFCVEDEDAASGVTGRREPPH